MVFSCYQRPHYIIGGSSCKILHIFVNLLVIFAFPLSPLLLYFSSLQALGSCPFLHVLLRRLGPYYIKRIWSTGFSGYFLNLRNPGHARNFDFLAQNQIYENILDIFWYFYELFGPPLYKVSAVYSILRLYFPRFRD